MRTLGKGAYGTAFLVMNKSSRDYAVIKQVDLSHMQQKDKQAALKEAKVLRVLNHPNIIEFKEVYRTKHKRLCIVMDYADGGDMTNYLKQRRESADNNGQPNYLSEDELLKFFTQICLAIKHVHDRHILHRDLKSQNIFLTEQGFIKLGDFGISRILSNTMSRA